MDKSVINLILRAVALAMGVAAVVLSLIDAATTETIVTLLGIGLIALGLDALDKGDS